MQVGELIDALQPYRGRGDSVVIRIKTEAGFYDCPSEFVMAQIKSVGHNGREVVIEG